MPKPLPLLVVGAILSQAASATALPEAGAIIVEMNRVRADPAAYARELEPLRRNFQGRILHEPERALDRITQEGARALDDAIAWLRHQAPMRPLGPNRRLALAAGDHARAQGASGVSGHGGFDGSSPLDRIERRGLTPSMVSEVIAYGPETAREVVRQFIIDDGVADRGHRSTIFSGSYTSAGAACGPHAVYGAMCVVELADDAGPAETAGAF